MKRLFLLLLVLAFAGCDSGNTDLPKATTNATTVHVEKATPQVVPSARLPRFAELQPEAQAVAVSLEFHLGPKGAAKYVDKIAKGDIAGAVALLEADRGKYATRRKAEAKLLRQALEKGIK